MNYKILLIALITITVSSCSTAYKAGQTPDDVYYSPAKEYTAKEEREKEDKYEDYARNQEDQYLRMKVRNRNRWSTIDDYDYWYDSRYDHCICNYNYHNSYGWNNWNRPRYGNYYYGNNYWYPGWGYGGSTVIINKYVPKPSNVNRPSLKGYSNPSYNNTNTNNSFRKIFTNPGSSSNSNSTYSNSTPSRTYNPSSSNSSSSSGSRSSSSSSSSSSGPVTRPSRGGN